MIRFAPLSALVLLCACAPRLAAQSTNSGTVLGTVVDPSGAALPGATVILSNPIRQFSRTEIAGGHGQFRFRNVPFDSYTLIAQSPKFQSAVQALEVQSTVPVAVTLKLALAGAATTVTVEAAGATAPTLSPTAQTNLDRTVITEMPTRSIGSGLSDLITYSSPDVAADSNGFFHPLGDHAEQTFVIDGQPISDQQSKLFSTSLPANAIESLDLITAAPSAAYGDKTSMVVEATTRSGLGASRPHGSWDAYYGSFGTVGENATFSLGNSHWGNFMALDSVRSGRFLDSPEFSPFHDVGNNGEVFDRLDFQPNANNIFHLDLLGARNWFQIPNTYDQVASGQDQRQQVLSFNIAPSYQHIFSATTLITVDPWLRRDHVNYYPSGNPFADQPATLGQDRYLTNLGGKVEVAYSAAHQNLTVGTQIMQTRLQEEFHLGLTNPLFNAVCVDAGGNAVAAPGVNSPSLCAGAAPGDAANPSFMPGLLPFDLTRGGSQFQFQGATNINEAAAYAQDGLTLGGLNLSAGVRLDHYAGLVTYTGVEPRLGFAYRLRPTGTVFRGSYARAYESPYNENLILSSATGAGGLATNVFGAYAAVPLQPGRRNSFDAGLQQNLGPYFQIDGDYFWKYTTSAFDFDTLFNTPITFPITWAQSKIDGFGLRISSANIHGFTLDDNLGHTRARFFGPETGGIIFNSPLDTGAFRINHDQAFQQTTNLTYRHGDLWTTFSWRFDSGLVAGAVPNLASVLALDGDQQQTIGFYCGTQVATLTAPITSCTLPYGQWGAKYVAIPAPGTENNDTNPPRIASRNVLDASLGDNNLRATELGVLTARLSVTNLANKCALYNFLSTFSGTHFLAPRSVQLNLGMRF